MRKMSIPCAMSYGIIPPIATNPSVSSSAIPTPPHSLLSKFLLAFADAGAAMLD